MGSNGTHGLSFLNNQVLNPGAASNEAEYYYPNHQSARLLWYHDHAFGITRTNAYAGVASAYIIRDAFEASLKTLGLPDFIENNGNEIPIIIQDKIFVGSNINTLDPTWVSKGLPKTPEALDPHVYEKNRWKLIGAGSQLPNPSVIAEMFGDTMLTNGVVYPEIPVEPRRYRLRILNACNARFLNLQLLVANYEGSAAIPTESKLLTVLSRTLSPVPNGSFSGLKPDFSKTRQRCLPTLPSRWMLMACLPEALSPATPNVGMS